MHALAVGYSPAYLAENADGVRRDWPRVPLPADRAALEASAALGERVAALLDTGAEVPGVTTGKVAPWFKTLGLISKGGGGQLDAAVDLAVTAGWGHKGKEGVTMPGKGRTQERPYDAAEAAALDAESRRLLGETTLEVYLNDSAYWRNAPANVWDYYIGGYQVVKKWLSYREAGFLGRELRPEEAREVTNMVIRLAALVLLRPKLDANYQSMKAAAFAWPPA